MEGPPASPEVFCRGLFFAECLTLGKEDVCRVSLFAECGTRQTASLPSARRLTLGKQLFAVKTYAEWCLPSVTLGKPFAECFWVTLGKAPGSGSVAMSDLQPCTN